MLIFWKVRSTRYFVVHLFDSCKLLFKIESETPFPLISYFKDFNVRV
jgi:hypothetical protein